MSEAAATVATVSTAGSTSAEASGFADCEAGVAVVTVVALAEFASGDESTASTVLGVTVVDVRVAATSVGTVVVKAVAAVAVAVVAVAVKTVAATAVAVVAPLGINFVGLSNSNGASKNSGLEHFVFFFIY